jgi:hypothetical protein
MKIDFNKLFSDDKKQVEQEIEKLENASDALYEMSENFDYDTSAETLRKYRLKCKTIVRLINTVKNYHLED